MNEILKKPVQYLKGVGPKRAGILKKINILTVGDLLYHFPREYQDRSNICPAQGLEHGRVATVMGRVLYARELKPRRGLTIIKLALDDGQGVFFAVWFNQKYVIKQYPPGTMLLVTGKVDKSYRGEIQLQVIDCEVTGESHQALHGGGIVPIYPLTEGISQKYIRSVMQYALQETASLRDFIPEHLLVKYRLPGLKKAISSIHRPENENDIRQARRRFIFEELFLLQLALAKQRKKIKRQQKSHRYPEGNGRLVEAFLKQLPFKLTADQIKVWNEIRGDMESSYPMNRLLQGDVGSGKTVVSALVLVKAVEAGLQGALMAPTEILAEQHYLGLSRWLKPLGINTALLTGSIKKSRREKLLAEIERGEVQVLIGTHALIQDMVSFKQLGAVVVDEQHRFGVKQRLALQAKGNLPDVLVMTATPIPRTLALTVYGDLDISVIYHLPPGRRPVRTYHVTHRAINDVYRLIRREVKNGKQAYIVCPLVEESEMLDVQAAVDLADRLSGTVFRDLNVGLLHGRMKAGEKEAVMIEFRDGNIDILVSTTVIEVGVDVPNATVMVIIDAHRFGLAQLHQLRGRVGRGRSQSYCILVADPKTEEGRQRMAAMVNSGDGFVLAEEDLRLRGPGEFFGVKQSGLPEFKIASIIRDRRAMECAREEAAVLIEKDPELQRPEHQLLAQELYHRFGKNEKLLNIG
ncbi:ATP-dependent DNA helicase RecG [Desulfohalotomaculum tongense]|uniref:ATP-dependent DNA helicase RecG n=1 Tax=Desulforadius tongensis TaxID=1216062 RepID=UPI001A9C6A21|nr:ATP-dependent DNA helicase RecG [Desulforadius tongensis]MBM7856192.1 ATP-dependent DNA helicase RecG [Desulforadius tongensis]